MILFEFFVIIFLKIFKILLLFLFLRQINLSHNNQTNNSEKSKKILTFSEGASDPEALKDILNLVSKILNFCEKITEIIKVVGNTMATKTAE